MINLTLTEDEKRVVQDILRQHIPDCEVWAFGSRVKGQVKPYSDLDLVILGTEKLSKKIIYKIKDAFEESKLSFRVDVLDWNLLSPEFQAIINENYYVIQLKAVSST